MLLPEERQEIVKYGRKLITSHLTTGSGGNISIYNREENLVAVTPSGVEYFEMEPEDVVITTPEGKIVEGKLTPTSELNFHLALQKQRSDIHAVVHTHSVYAVTLACLHWELPAVHYLVGLCGDKVPLADYAVFGSEELAKNILRAIGHYNACLMANHGLVCVGKNIERAFSIAEQLELAAQVYYQTKCAGQPVLLTESEMDEALKKFGTYGQKQNLPTSA